MEIIHTEQDWKSLMRQSHGIKGSAASIGATDLHKLTHELELKCDKIIEEQTLDGIEGEIIEQIKREYGRVLKSVHSLIQNQNTAVVQSPAESIDIKKLSLVLNDLKKAISQSAPVTIKEKLKEVRNQIGENDTQRVQNHINDYDEALKEIDKLALKYTIEIE